VSLLVTLSLASCTTPNQTVVPPAPTISSTPTGVVEVLPTPTPAATVTAGTGESGAPAATVPPLDPEWVQQSYGKAWTIGYPASWTVNDAGAHEGALQLQGDYAGHSYSVTYNYPMGILSDSLEVWVDESLLSLTLEAREAVVVSDVTVANTPAKKVLNVPTAEGTTTAHHVYIWRDDENSGTKNPRLITITQTDSQPIDAVAMDQLLDRLLLTVQ
jgi:hypothetical protein